VERSGDGIVGLFDTSTNLSAANDTISTTPAAIGVTSSSNGYLLQNVWTGQVSPLGPTGSITASVPSEGVAFYRVIPLSI
jgi:Alpha galactosidase C-terminal beta sandwich domain